MKSLILVIVIFGLMVGVAFAGGVQSDNNGNAGYIFVATGENHGKDSIGVWTDPSELGLKGEKGDTGATGQAGRDGIDGINGINGQDGLNGVDGLNGADGQQGEKGDTGEQGIAGENGEHGEAGTDGKEGDKGDTGDKGDEGKQGQQGIQGQQGKGLEDRVELIGEIRVLDTRKTTWSVYAGQDVNNHVGIVGAKFTYKLGRSYEERRLDELEAKINMSTSKPESSVEVVPTATGFKIQVN